MTNWSAFPELGLRVCRATVTSTAADREVVVLREGDPARNLKCDVLETAILPVRLEPGDTVLILLPEGDDDRAVVLGRIGPARSQVSVRNPADETAQDELVVEAKKNLTLKCGEGSITIREDGKILIKGKDLVSHAQRMNRIKGGSVSIN